ncbi:MAG: DUF1289 domain-containing protein [Sedimenticola sp.]
MTFTERALVPASSPCVGVCKLDDNTGWCFGCGRTSVEIEGWQHFNLETSVDHSILRATH